MTTQTKELKRVRGRIGQAVLDFFEHHGIGHEFHGAELYVFVSSRVGCSPGSADRVMRMLDDDRLLAYECIARSTSRYRIVPIPPPPDAEPVQECFWGEQG